jgi:hypothetical protein
MFNLEQSIADWRRQMLAAGVNGSDVLDELEGHLRADFRALVSSGNSEEEAFQRAVAQVGAPGALRMEFNKLGDAMIRPVKIGTTLWITATVVVAALLARRFLTGAPNLVTGLHIFTITIGYCTMFLLGTFGIFHVGYRAACGLSPVRQRSLNLAVGLFTRIAAGLVIAGMVLGLFVSQRFYGRYWSWDPREIGGLCVVGWLTGGAFILRRGYDRLAMLMSVGGNVVVALAWFHAGLVATHPRQNVWPWWLDLFIGINVLFLIMGLAPVIENKPKNV